MWKQYYPFVGQQAAATYGYKVATKADERLKTEPSVFSICLVVPGFNLAADLGDKAYPGTVVWQLHDYEGTYGEVWSSEKHGNLLDIGGTRHHHKVLFLDGPKASLVRFWQIDAWHPCCSASSKGILSKIRTELNYADLIGNPYTNTTARKLSGMFLRQEQINGAWVVKYSPVIEGSTKYGLYYCRHVFKGVRTGSCEVKTPLPGA